MSRLSEVVVSIASVIEYRLMRRYKAARGRLGDGLHGGKGSPLWHGLHTVRRSCHDYLAHLGASCCPSLLTASPLPSPAQDPAPERQVYRLPKNAYPHDVAPAPDGKVWYSAQQIGALGILDPKTGGARHVPLGKGSAPHGVIQGPDGAAWLTDGGQNAIVRVDPKTEEISLPLLENTGRRVSPAAIVRHGFTMPTAWNPLSLSHPERSFPQARRVHRVPTLWRLIYDARRGSAAPRADRLPAHRAGAPGAAGAQPRTGQVLHRPRDPDQPAPSGGRVGQFGHRHPGGAHDAVHDPAPPAPHGGPRRRTAHQERACARRAWGRGGALRHHAHDHHVARAAATVTDLGSGGRDEPARTPADRCWSSGLL